MRNFAVAAAALGVFLFASNAVSANSDPADLSIEQLKRTVGIKEGRYKQTGKASTKCLEGELSLYKASGGEILVNLGSHSLANGLRPSPFDYNTDNGVCKNQFKGSFSKGKIDVTNVEKCRDSESLTIVTSAKFEKNRITYERTWTVDKGGTPPRSVSCSLRRVN